MIGGVFLLDVRGAMRGWMGGGSEGARTGKGLVARLPAKARDTLVVDAVLLIVSHMVAGKAE